MMQANHLHNKKILLGITGSIAAYKAATLTRLLVKAGAEVKVLMSPAASTFITPLTLATLSKNPVLTEISSEAAWNNHVELGLWADMMLIAPATANTMAKMAHGICDDIISAVYLSARCPVWVAPAMDLDMWQHPSTQRNIAAIQKDGVHLIDPANGELASGLTGIGRMAEPESIIELLNLHLAGTQNFSGKKVIVTAGPTYEPIDPVRFIGNYSSGKMGFALAKAFADQGAQVQLITGPTHEIANHPNISIQHIHTAEEMLHAVQVEFDNADLAVFCAAVADYRPKEVQVQKIKKSDSTFELALEKTDDIAKWAGLNKKPNQILVGFALETEKEMEHAKDKLSRKNLDAIVLNSPNNPNSTFGHDTNQVTWITADNKLVELELESKSEIARKLVNLCSELIEQKNKSN
ncbi:MAG: bifunctional phosphopantothenoylcysteine decarboxylase/phosphopantothenate--cysteine ligase CoaBC [Saprospiraceae bacterium]